MSWFIGKSKKKLLAPNSSKGARGFSLLELIVVITIFLIITAVVIADIPSFREKSALDLTVSEVATYIRGAQVYGATQKSGQVSSTFYGVSFIKNSSGFFLFRNSKPISSERPEESYEIKGFKIAKITVVPSSGVDHSVEWDNIDIVFSTNNYTSTIGTDLEPSIYVDYNDKSSLYTSFQFIEIRISSDKGVASPGCIRVYQNGQIAPSQCLS